MWFLLILLPILTTSYHVYMSDDKFSIEENGKIFFSPTYFEYTPTTRELQANPIKPYHIQNSPFIRPNHKFKYRTLRLPRSYTQVKDIFMTNRHYYISDVKEIQFIQMKGYFKMIILHNTNDDYPIVTCHIVIPMDHIENFISNKAKYSNVPLSFVLKIRSLRFYSSRVEVNALFETGNRSRNLSMRKSQYYNHFVLKEKFFVQMSSALLCIDVEGPLEQTSVLSYVCKKNEGMCTEFMFDEATGYSRFNFHKDRGVFISFQSYEDDGQEYYEFTIADESLSHFNSVVRILKQ
jgi:hypothetical protein